MMRPVADRARDLLDTVGIDALRAQPCVCGAPKAEHSGARNTGRHTGTGCARYRDDVAATMAVRAFDAEKSDPVADIEDHLRGLYPRPTPDPGGWATGPSDYLRCRRQIQYREKPPAGVEPVHKPNLEATLGSMYAEMLRQARSGRYPWRLYEHEVRVPGLDRPGRLDEYDTITRRLRDWKTTGHYKWEQIGVDGADPAHKGQLDIYAYGLEEAGFRVDVAELEYVNRAFGEVERFEHRYRRDDAETALDWLYGVNAALDMGVDLPRDRRGPSTDEMCRLCPFVEHCWNVAAAEAAGRSPESYTILGPDPTAEQIEWAARRTLDFKRDLNAAKTAYEEARYLLTGVPDGTYGGIVVTEKSRRMPEWKAWAELVRAALDDGATPEQVKAIEVPRRKDVWVEVKPVRAAELGAGLDVEHAVDLAAMTAAGNAP